MARARRDYDPLPSWHFAVEIDGIAVATFAAVDGLAYESEAIEYRTSENPFLPRYRPGAAKFGTVTLKRGRILCEALQNWMAAVTAGIYEHKDVFITLYDNAHEQVGGWHLMRCLPTKWQIDSLDGKGTDVLYESLELRVEEAEKM